MATVRAPFASVEELRSAFAGAEVSLDELVPDENGSLRRLARASGPPPRLTTLAGTEPPEIVMKAPLSQGGMGQVLVADQMSVGREVAVKVASKGVMGTIARGELVVEGRLAGQLEHPNIVPVHVIGTTADGSPLIVMQRVDGEAWSDVLARGRDLRRDVDILMQVLRALHFAHARGVVHRDVKPRNVMLGRYGEVFLLDWGIAVGVGAGAPKELPRAGDVKEIAGTPPYMAPEMVTPPADVDARTDVYLAGAVLYEIITGQAPHERGDLAASLFAAQVSAAPAFGDDVPQELAAICARAMARDPDARFASADELRLALDDFQRHERTRELCARGEARLALLREPHAPPAAATAAETPPPRASGGTSDDAAALRAYTEARFAFAQALKSWPESPRARRGIVDAVVAMARREIAAGRHAAAALVAAELEPQTSEERAIASSLHAELAGLRARLDADAAGAEALKDLAREFNATTAERERALVLLAAAAGFLALMSGFAVLAARGIFVAGAGTFAAVLAVLSVAFVIAGVAFPVLRSTTASRQMFIVMCAGEIGFTAAYAAAWRFGLPLAPTLALAHACMALFAAAHATRDAHIWRAVAVCVAIVPAVALLPAYAYLVSGVGTVLAVVIGGSHLWWAAPPSPPRGAA